MDMDFKEVTHNNMPSVLAIVLAKLEALDEKINRLQSSPLVDEKQWLNMMELIDYLPSHPAEQTVYGWTSAHKIPFHKKGKSIMFKKTEIDAWLENGTYRKSESDLDQEAVDFVNNKINVQKPLIFL
jgi:hypothetical protein